MLFVARGLIHSVAVALLLQTHGMRGIFEPLPGVFLILRPQKRMHRAGFLPPRGCFISRRASEGSTSKQKLTRIMKSLAIFGIFENLHRLRLSVEV